MKQAKTKTNPVCVKFFLLGVAAMLFGMGILALADEQAEGNTIVPPDRRVSDVEAQTALAQSEAALGHAALTRSQYRVLLNSTNASWHVRLSFADASLLWGDFLAAEEIYRDYLRAFPEDRDVTMSLAAVLTASQQFEQAEGQFRLLLLDEPENARFLLGLAGVARAEGNLPAALAIVDQVLAQDHTNTAALAAKSDLLLHGRRWNATKDVFAKTAETAESRIQSLEKAVSADDSSFSARMALAQALASDRQFDRAIAIYSELHRQFPESYSILIEWARTLSWARRYDESLALYARVADLAPENPVPLREMARVAIWAKQMDDAQIYYGRLLEPSVDVVLFKKLSKVMESYEGHLARDILAQIERLSSSGEPYDAYEWLCHDSTHLGAQADLIKALEKVRIECLPWYRIQKAAYLERVEKRLTWQKQHLRALQPCRQLVEFAPGNQEALYDLSQLELALNLNRDAVMTTKQLFSLNPFHNLAPLVLENMAIRDNLYLQLSGSFWHEKGRGELVDIERHRYDAGAGIPILGRGYIQAFGHRWDERPGKLGNSFDAAGFSVYGDGVIAPWLKANAGITFKDYADSSIEDTETGHVEGTVNLRDIVVFSLRRERTDELYNEFGVRQKTQADSWLLKGHSFLTPDLEIAGLGRLTDYSDENSGEQAYINLAYRLTDHPRILKGAVFGEARDTDEETRYVYGGEALTNVVHPYWTPRNYQAWGVMLEWYHDVSPVFSRGTDLRFYDLSITLRDDTEHNPTIEVKAQLRWEFNKRWFLGIEAALMRSEQWDAEGLWTTLKRHF